jgi:protein subunit release factor B
VIGKSCKITKGVGKWKLRSLAKRIVIVEERERERERERKEKQHKLARETSHIVKLTTCNNKQRLSREFFLAQNIENIRRGRKKKCHPLEQ